MMAHMSTDVHALPAPRAAILFLAFNRPQCFARVLDALSGAAPRPVFVAIDGPRADRSGEAERCAEVRVLAERIDWAAPLHLKAEPRNLGCGPAVRAAIDWAFSQASELIVLEDDCLPDPSFLRFCDAMLARYRDDTRVMQIGGSNWGAAPERFVGASYAFTSFAPVWGWATWRRAWELYDYTLESWPRVRDSGLAEGMSLSRRFRRLLERDWDIVCAGGGTWDHQWQYSVLRHHGLNVCPARNLILNIGFGGDGTQITEPDRIFSRLPLEALEFPLRHPPEVARSANVEAVFERIYWQKLGWPARTFRRVVRHRWLNAALRRSWRALAPRPR